MESAVLPEAVGPKIAMVFNEFLLHVVFAQLVLLRLLAVLCVQL